MLQSSLLSNASKHFALNNTKVGMLGDFDLEPYYTASAPKLVKQYFNTVYIYKTSRVCWYNPLYIMRFFQLVPWKHESVGRVLSGHQLGKPSDVRRIISTHEGSFVFIIHPT